ncbi:MAG TPA: GNAT family N-acetyltransferase [Pirellulales bacterium]|jgi:RimJ/RimL family protein N-acetyltransferase|nr:GNAT family N-acetyltransferase [Pirellulales bacterium]
MDIEVTPAIQLTDFRSSDKVALVEHLSDWEVYRRTLRIPRPYTDDDADRWLASLERSAHNVNWAVRDRSDYLIGGVGLEGDSATRSHRAEIGYWLARSHWGQGIMTAVVGAVCRHALDSLGLAKITAHVLPANEASTRVLLKNGFAQEGYFRRHFLKDGELIDTRAFGLLR